MHVGPEGPDYMLTVLEGGAATWVNGRLLRNRTLRLTPGDVLELGCQGDLPATFRVKLCHDSVWDQVPCKGSRCWTTLLLRYLVIPHPISFLCETIL